MPAFSAGVNRKEEKEEEEKEEEREQQETSNQPEMNQSLSIEISATKLKYPKVIKLWLIPDHDWYSPVTNGFAH